MNVPALSQTARAASSQTVARLDGGVAPSPRRHHYLLPDGFVQIAFSGGRTSAYMLHEILEANGGLPDRAQVTFQNTGREMPQTLDFVADVGRRWGVNIVWLEYLPNAPHFQIVGHNSAARNGEPFDALIDKKQYLPNQQARFCTIELKIRTAKRYLMSLGWRHWKNCVGIRADEPRRLNKPAPKDRWTVWTPLADAGVGRHEVARFWEAQPFDLELPNVKGNCWLGNCDGCFLKSEAHVAAFTREYPKRAAWWEAAGARVSAMEGSKGRPADNAQFSKRYSRAELREFMDRQGDWALSTDGALCQTDGGECMA
jgi:3'-phosphoadenosine 5'-phosphosulfate sulfotransferase (PAPS reductase)/FAD synthetase